MHAHMIHTDSMAKNYRYVDPQRAHHSKSDTVSSDKLPLGRAVLPQISRHPYDSAQPQRREFPAQIRSRSVGDPLPRLFTNQLLSFSNIQGCQLIKPISSGTYGKVYHIKMTNLRVQQNENLNQNPDAALKVFSGGSRQQDMLECITERELLRLISSNESKLGKKLQIAHVRDDIPGVHPPNLMTELIPGADVHKYLNSKLKRSSISQIVAFATSMMRQVGNTLKDLHAMNIYHNDLKPANIIYNPQNALFYVVDFGLSVPLSYLSRAEFSSVYFWTTLPFLSPFHVDIMRKSKVESNSQRVFRHIQKEYDIKNDEKTRKKASSADYYSLGITAINIIGASCDIHSYDALCLMARRIVQLQRKWSYADEQAFTSWEMQKLYDVMFPYWKSIQNEVSGFVRQYPYQYKEFMELLTGFVMLNPRYFDS